MMAAPGVVAPIAAGGLKGPAEIGFREGSNILGNAELLGCVVERGEGRAQFGVQRIVGIEFVGMRVKPAQRAEEDLAPHAEISLNLDNLCDLLQLRAQRALGELRFE